MQENVGINILLFCIIFYRFCTKEDGTSCQNQAFGAIIKNGKIGDFDPKKPFITKEDRICIIKVLMTV